MSELIDEKWHIGKTVNIATILIVAFAILGGIRQFDAVQAQQTVLQEKLKISSEEHIRSESVVSMFEVRDVQLKNIVEDMREMKDEQKETNRQIAELNATLQKFYILMSNNKSPTSAN